MRLYSVIKNDGPGDALAWKFLGEDFNTGSQLIVAESEEALFFKDGIIEQIFDGGRYSLGTSNYPFISKFRNIFSGGSSAFNCKVYFINKAHQLELFWGTDTPIQMRDPVYMLQTSIQARGSYSIQVTNSKKFLLKLIGNNIQHFTQQELNGYFRNAFLQYIKDEIPKLIKVSGKEILEICTEKTNLTEALTPILNDVLDQYGVRLVNFYISAIDIPENDPNRMKLEEAYANKAVMSVLGHDWGKQQSSEILKTLADSSVAALDMGTNTGSIFSDLTTQMFTPVATPPIQSRQDQQVVQSDPRFTQSNYNQGNKTDCPTCRYENVQGAKFCNECGTKLIIEKIHCTKCGIQMPETAKFCNECGTKRV